MVRDFDTSLTDDIVCPHCGHEFSDSWEYDLDGSAELECEECEKKFFATRNISVTYSTSPIAGDPA